ncbi:MAG TPA: HPF/RaiA family ribosome-associated protein [Steroidobacteraceae bacterium]
MQILVSSDERICCDTELIQRIEGVLRGPLERFASHLVQVTVSLCDLDSSDVGDRDKICSLEARLSGAAALTVRHEGFTLTEAIHGAADKLERALEGHFRAARRTTAVSGKQPLTLPAAEALTRNSAIANADP